MTTSLKVKVFVCWCWLFPFMLMFAIYETFADFVTYVFELPTTAWQTATGVANEM